MVIHKAEKCNINNVSENKIHDDTSGYNNIIIFFIITVISNYGSCICNNSLSCGMFKRICNYK